MNNSTLLVPILIFMAATSVSAVTHTVGVGNNFFQPSTLSVHVGDTIRWVRQAGTHTTTSTTIPAGAIAWDAPINASASSFSYVVAVPGSYQYVCSFHPGMDGSFNATVSGTVEASPDVAFWVGANVASDRFTVNYRLNRAAYVALELWTLNGQRVRNTAAADKPAGTFTETIDAVDLPRGVYVVALAVDGRRLTRKVLLQ